MTFQSWKSKKDLTPLDHLKPHFTKQTIGEFFQISNFDMSQFCSLLSYDDEQSLIQNPQAISITK